MKVEDVPQEWVDTAKGALLLAGWRDYGLLNALAAVAPLIQQAERERCISVVRAEARELRDNDARWGGPLTANAAVICPTLDRLAATIRAGKVTL
jgi:hypothetical protein